MSLICLNITLSLFVFPAWCKKILRYNLLHYLIMHASVLRLLCECHFAQYSTALHVFSLVWLGSWHHMLCYYRKQDCFMLCVSLLSLHMQCMYMCVCVCVYIYISWYYYILLCVCHHVSCSNISLFSAWCVWSWITACFTATQSWTASCCVCHCVTTYVLLCAYYCVYVIISV